MLHRAAEETETKGEGWHTTSPQVDANTTRELEPRVFEAKSNAFPRPSDSSAEQGRWDILRMQQPETSTVCAFGHMLAWP